MLSVVIPSYRRPELILRLLADLYAQEGAEFEVIVVDDCSPDDSVEQFRKAFPQARIFRNQKNGGPAVARNLGIKMALGDIIVGFDSDVTVPDRQLLRKVVDSYTKHPDATGFAFKLLALDGTDDEPRWWHSRPFDTHKDAMFETAYFSGTAYSFRRGALLAAGLYPEYLYMHYEEYVLAYRILDRGGKILYLPNLSAVHHAHPVSRRSEIKVYYKSRNQILLAFDLLPKVDAALYLVPRILKNLADAIFGWSLKPYFRSLRDAYRLIKNNSTLRAPVQASTLSRIRSLRS